jgi:hypothetical protein
VDFDEVTAAIEKAERHPLSATAAIDVQIAQAKALVLIAQEIAKNRPAG